jgi:hypothetical protein
MQFDQLGPSGGPPQTRARSRRSISPQPSKSYRRPAVSRCAIAAELEQRGIPAAINSCLSDVPEQIKLCSVMESDD